MAAHLISDEFNKDVYNLDGGILAWEGEFLATGKLDEGLFLIEGLSSKEDFLKLAYTLEDGAKRFYNLLAQMHSKPEARESFQSLAEIEDRHKSVIERLYPGVSVEQRFQHYMESGLSISETIEKIKARKMTYEEVLEYAMQIEVNSLDLYPLTFI